MSRTLEQVLSDDYTSMTDYELHQEYDQLLDDVHGDVEIMGMSYSTSNAIKALDEVAYNEGFNNWVDGNYQEVDDVWYQVSEVEEAQDIVDEEKETEEDLENE